MTAQPRPDRVPTGRFAPSPSGPLHAGSLLAALASFIDAKAQGGRWLLRFDDIDSDRSRADAVADICHCLAAHGLHHDGDVLFQSRRTPYYDAALDTLSRQNRLYGCACTRAALRERAERAGHSRYDRQCASRQFELDNHAVRVRVDDRLVQWREGDAWSQERVRDTAGDFVLKRRDGVYAYQLAIVVDDSEDQVTTVTRGADLRDNTGRQVYLQHLLALSTPRYLHVPLVLGEDGRKLSKSNGAVAVDASRPLPNLLTAWSQLSQPAPPTRVRTVDEFLGWARHNWQPTLASARHC